MSLLKNLHQSRIPLRVDQVNIGVKIVVSERVQPLVLFPIFLLLLILVLLNQMILG